MARGIRNPGVRQCLGFCSADSKANEYQKSAVQKPKHCLTPGFLIPLVIYPNLQQSDVDAGDEHHDAKHEEDGSGAVPAAAGGSRKAPGRRIP